MSGHYPNCDANYPEKVPGEAAQQLTRIDIGDGEWVDQCVDCGAIIASCVFCPECARRMSNREYVEQMMCDDCRGE